MEFFSLTNVVVSPYTSAPSMIALFSLKRHLKKVTFFDKKVNTEPPCE